MNATEVRTFLSRRPFEPFRVLLQNGEAFEVRSPELAVVMKSRLFIAFPGEDQYALCPFPQIAAIEGASARPGAL